MALYILGQYVPLSEVGQASGVASLNGSGQVPLAELPVVAVSNNLIMGSGPPALGVGNDGWYYLDNTTGFYWGPRVSGAWPTEASWCPPGTVLAQFDYDPAVNGAANLTSTALTAFKSGTGSGASAIPDLTFTVPPSLRFKLRALSLIKDGTANDNMGVGFMVAGAQFGEISVLTQVSSTLRQEWETLITTSSTGASGITAGASLTVSLAGVAESSQTVTMYFGLSSTPADPPSGPITFEAIAA